MTIKSLVAFEKLLTAPQLMSHYNFPKQLNMLNKFKLLANIYKLVVFIQRPQYYISALDFFEKESKGILFMRTSLYLYQKNNTNIFFKSNF